MENKIFKIVIDDKLSNLSRKYKTMSSTDKYEMGEMYVDTYFDYEENNKYNIFMICDLNSLEQYLMILDTYNIEYYCRDFSEDILYSKIDLYEELVEKFYGYEKVKWGIFKTDIDKWYFNNLEIDIVLDRINEVGSVAKLNDSEKKFLKNLSEE